MVKPIYGGAMPSDNPAIAARPAVFARARAGQLPPSHHGVVDHPMLTPDDQVAILHAVDLEGFLGIGDLAAAIPNHVRPISAILALVDAGLLEIDAAAAFDASLRIWRVPNRDR